MKKRLTLYVLLVCISMHMTAQTPAFEGAGGGGMYTTGGRGGRVLYVTSLADDGTVGTLRWAINQTGARMVLFKVSGQIVLKSRLDIKNPNLTIAGQTAPGDGICVSDYETVVDADNVIIRYMRFRLGNNIPTNASDAIWGRYRKNIILDHCSISWSIDECASFYSNENFTMQWCIISESLNNAGHPKGAHGYGGLWGGKSASFHHNLIAHHNSRNPRFNGWKRSGLSYTNPLDEERLDFRNNVVYNFGDNGSYGGESAGKYNVVANYIKYGPGTKSSIRYKMTQIDIDASPSLYPPGYGAYYIADNFIFGSTANSADNWAGVTYASGVDKVACRTTLPFASLPIVQHTAEVAFNKVLATAGASLSRDAVDVRVVNETRNGTYTYKGSVSGKLGLIDTQNDVGGWPVYNSTVAPNDSDNDGIPDGWLDQNYPGKLANELNNEGYTYLELYLHSLVRSNTLTENEGGAISGVEQVNNSGVTIRYSVSTRQLRVTSEAQILSVQLFNQTGQQVYSTLTSSTDLSVSLSQFQPAMYILKVTTASRQTATVKVMITR